MGPPFTVIPCAGVLPLTAAREADLRAALVAAARGWIGTPYRQLGATRGVAVDCSMLLVRCVIEAGIVEEFDPRPYPPTWFLHQADERYIDWLAHAAAEVAPGIPPRPGDIMAFQVGRAFAHSGIISDAEHLVHAFADEGQVRESALAHPALSFMGRRAHQPRPRRTFDLFARLRTDPCRF